jgi:hypothetical protein
MIPPVTAFYNHPKLTVGGLLKSLQSGLACAPATSLAFAFAKPRCPPGQFADRLRVEAAQQMIDSSSMGLKEIADVWLPFRRFDGQNFSTGYWHDRRRVH